MGTSTLSRFQRGALGQLVSEGHKIRQEMADSLGVKLLRLLLTWELLQFIIGLIVAGYPSSWLICPIEMLDSAGLASIVENLQVVLPSNNDPKNVNQRLAFGHWEVDTVLSSRGKSRSCLVTFVERKIRLLWAIKAPNRTVKAFNTTLGTFGSQVKSITVDHGKEFTDHQTIEQGYQIKVYFCHPYSPWERGSNEYFNRRLRWFFPKKTDFSQVTMDEILTALELINQRPLKIHHHQTAIESFRACSD